MSRDPSDPALRQRRLEEALRIWLARASDEPDHRSDAEWLAAHPEVRDLLEPMLGSATSEQEAEPALSDKEPVTRFQDFRILRELGRGGMGIVYEAEQLALQRRVALKVLPPGFAASPSAVVRFRREARAVAALDHPAIVRIHTVAKSDESWFQVMELVDGSSLAAILEAIKTTPAEARDGSRLWKIVAADPEGVSSPQPRDWPATYAGACVHLLAPVAEALSHAHERGILHRDVKPGNVLVRRDGAALLSDFGLARREDQPALSDTGAVAGTPSYLAPEQIRSAHAIDGRADLFALGTTLWEMLALRRPFTGPTTAAVLDAICTVEAPDLTRCATGVDRDLAAIVARMLEKDPEARYRDASECARDLRAWLAGRPVVARRTTPLQRAWRWARREKVKAGLGAGLVAAASATALALWFVSQSARERGAGLAALRAEELDEALCDAFAELSEGTPARAKELVERALAIDPSNPEAIACAVLLARRRGGAKEAVATLPADEVVASHPALLQLSALVQQELGNREAADALRAKLPAADTRRTSLELFVTGQLEMEAGHRGEAAAFVRAVEVLSAATLANARARPLYWFELAHAAGHAGDRSRARDAETAIATLWPNSPRGTFWSGFAHHRFDRAKAGKLMREALEDRQDWATAWFNYGAFLMHQQDFAGAAEAYTRCQTLRPDNEMAKQRAVDAYLRAGSLDAAQTALQRILTGDPANPRGKALEARILLARGRPADAERSAEASLAADPRAVDALIVRAHIHAGAGRLAEACKDLESALACEPAQVELRVTLVNHLVTRKEFEKAEVESKKAVAARPEFVPARLARLRLLRDRDGDGEALAFARAWLQEAPKEPEAAIQVARLLLEPFARGTRAAVDPGSPEALKEAEQLAIRALAIAPASGPAHWALGEARLHLGSTSLAIESLERARRDLPKQGSGATYYRALVEHALEVAQRSVRRTKGGK